MELTMTTQEINYKVGTTVIDTIDEKRQEVLGPATGNRVVMARLYYPAIVKEEQQVVIPKKTVGEMYADAQPVQTKFPLIIYNHGYGSYVEANNNLCCQLAARGYVVAAVGHAYEAEKLTLSDGTEILLDKSIRKKQIQPQIKGSLAAICMQTKKGSPEELYAGFDAFQKKYCRFLNERLPEWAKDVQCIVELLKLNYADYIDFTLGIGMTGHSFGGNLAYYMCMNFEEYVCGVNMDGGIFGHYAGMRMKRPFLQICNPGNEAVVSKALLDTDAPVEYEVFHGAKHLGFTDMAYYVKSKTLMGRVPYKEMNQRLFRLHLDFFEKYLKIRNGELK